MSSIGGLKLYSTDELKAELKRRATKKPQQLRHPDFTTLKVLCVEYIDDLHESGRPRRGIEAQVFETAIEAVFGEGIWEWANPILEEGDS